ncbi:MAG: hypothetical protein CM1200mP1_14390 [Candidatus Neomarinimicrobiota bacterium]|nr:MAG: hypothetical protein CM1200mP1_14390 [Candidatus Neomarinimicrobiota bacterium]
MIFKAVILLFVTIFTVPELRGQQRGDYFKPLPQRTIQTDREALRLMRNGKLDLVLPGSMRDNDVDMWIHVSRGGDPLTQYFGSFSGYLIFSDLGTESNGLRLVVTRCFENIDVEGSWHLRRAFNNYNYNNTDPRQGFTIPEVYNEITDFVAERDPKRIAVNFSEYLPAADGISYSSYLKLERILGPIYSKRIVSAEDVITDFIVRRTSREVAAQTEVLALARQLGLQNISKIVPGVTTIKDIGGRLYYSANTRPSEHEKIFHPLLGGSMETPIMFFSLEIFLLVVI